MACDTNAYRNGETGTWRRKRRGGAGFTLLRFQRNMSPTHTTAIPHVFCSERKVGCRLPWIRCRWPWIHSDRPWIRHRRLSTALDLPQSQSRQRLCVVAMDESVDRAEWMEEKVGERERRVRTSRQEQPPPWGILTFWFEEGNEGSVCSS